MQDTTQPHDAGKPGEPLDVASQSGTAPHLAYSKPPSKLSPKLTQMLKDASPEQIRQASKIVAALLLAKAKKRSGSSPTS